MFAIKTDDVKQHVCTDMCITTTSEKTFYLSCFSKFVQRGFRTSGANIHSRRLKKNMFSGCNWYIQNTACIFYFQASKGRPA